MSNGNGDAIRVSGPVNEAGTTMSFETGRLAQLADGAVVVQLGDTDGPVDGRHEQAP